MAANITGSPFAAFFPGMLLAVAVVVVAVAVVVVASHLLRITARQRKKLFRSFFL